MTLPHFALAEEPCTIAELASFVKTRTWVALRKHYYADRLSQADDGVTLRLFDRSEEKEPYIARLC